MDLLRTDSEISRAQIATQLGLTEAQVIHYLRVMKIEGLIRREGATKKGRWVVVG